MRQDFGDYPSQKEDPKGMYHHLQALYMLVEDHPSGGKSDTIDITDHEFRKFS